MSPSKLPVWIALAGSGLAGMLVAVQSRVNGGLSLHLGNGYLTAALSFGSGFVLLALMMCVSPRARAGLRDLRAELRARRFPAWALVGGACGAFFVLGQGLVATVIGVALFTVGVVAGQVLGGLVIDRIGLGPGGRVDPTAQRLIGSGLVLLGVAVSVSGGIGANGAASLIVIPVIAGAAVAWQSAVNGLVRSVSRSTLTATFVSFGVGTAVLVVAAAISVALSGWPRQWPAEPWYYAGGVFGVIFIAIASVLVRTAGVLLLSMSNVAGQLIASVLLEAGLPLAGGVSAGLLGGSAIALAAVVIAALPARARRRQRA